MRIATIVAQVTTTVKDGVWEDHFTRPGNADSYYRNTFDGDKMRVVSPTYSLLHFSTEIACLSYAIAS